VIVVDEVDAGGTRHGHIGLRRWDRNNRADCRIEALVDALLATCKEAYADTASDVRDAIPDIKASMAAMKDRPMPVLTPTSSTAGYYEAYPVRKGAEVCQFFAQCGYCKCAPLPTQAAHCARVRARPCFHLPTAFQRTDLSPR
jgi:hypothetical protein